MKQTMNNQPPPTRDGRPLPVTTCSASWPRPWRRWNGNYQKILYDIQTTWGKTIIGCWPNAGKMNAADGTGRSWKPHQVAMIRRSIKEPLNETLPLGAERMSEAQCSTPSAHSGILPQNTIKLNRILYVYALNGVIKCLSAEEIQETELLAAGWKHTATIDPALWIEAMANGKEDPSDMLDELQFSPANYKPTDR